MFSSRQSFMNGHKRQKGVSLLTIALLLLLLGGALMAGISYFRAQIPSDVASSQKEALAWADKAIIGFASIHHRLPCPAATPTGDEDCTFAKGWLPAKALNLDATMFEPGLLPMKYMVYRNATTLGGNRYMHRDLAANETISSRVLPYNAYAPIEWSEGAVKDITDIVDMAMDTVDPSYHKGRFTGRNKYLNTRNGLDMCETMRLAYSSVLEGNNASYAHYERGGSPINVAYGLASSGMVDASGANNNRFDGANAGAAVKMEPPDKTHGYNYDDYVFVRDLPSLMSALGCSPAHYNMSISYVAPVASGSFENLDDYKNDISTETDTEVTDIEMPTQLLVDYAREGIVATTVSSVNTVAMMADTVDEAMALRDMVVENAEDTVANATQQAVLTGIGIATAIVGLVSNVVALAKAIAAIAASLGFHVGAWVAAVAYAAGIVLSGVAVGLSIAAMVALIAAAVKAGNVVAALGGDTKKISDFCEKADGAVDKDEMLKNLKEQRSDLEKERDNAKAKRDAAKKEYDRLTSAINSCYDELSNPNNKPRVTLNGSNPVVTCTETLYNDRYYCFESSSRDVLIRYGPFRDLDLYQAKETAQQDYDEAVKKRNDLNSKITKLQDTSSIDDLVQSYRQSLVNSGATNIDAKVAAYRQRLETRNAEDLAKAIAERDALNTLIPGRLTAANNAKDAVTDAEEALSNADISNDWTTCKQPQEGRGTVYCGEMYDKYCTFRGRDLRYWIITKRRDVEALLGNWWQAYYLCVIEGEDNCQEPYYYAIWLEYQRADEAFKMAQENLIKLNENISAVENMDFSNCVSNSNTVLLWTSDEAQEVLRRVDRRAVLQ